VSTAFTWGIAVRVYAVQLFPHCVRLARVKIRIEETRLGQFR
jgi:hypothetical protein